MTVTTAETLSVGGVILNTLAKNIESLTGRLKVAPLRTDNLIIPGRHGRLRSLVKWYDEGEIVLPMWVRGCNDDGTVPEDTTTRTMFFQNVDTLTKLFRPGDGMVELLHTLPDGSVRRAWCEVTEAIDFTVQGGNMPLGKFSVSLRVPSSFWEDEQAQSIDLLITQNGQVPALAGMTAPLDDAIFTITGPATNVRVESLYNGVSLQNPNWFQFNDTVPATKTLTVNCGNWSLTGSSGFTPSYAKMGNTGSSRFLVVVPGPFEQAPGLKITATNTSSASKVTMVAKRKYLVG